MLKILIALFLLLVCGVECGGINRHVIRTASQFPCSKENIIFAFDASNQINYYEYQTQRDFLANDVFQNWTHFDSLAIFGYAEDVNGYNFGKIKSKQDVKDFLSSEEQLDEDPDICQFFTFLNSMRQDNMNFIVFVSYFSETQVDKYCKIGIDGINQVANKISFVVIADQAKNEENLIKYFPTSTIIEWNIDTEKTPKNYETLFWSAYGCDGPVPS